MIVLKVHVGDGITLRPETNPPVAGYRDAVFAFSVTLERMELPARHSHHLRKVVGKLQGGQDRWVSARRLHPSYSAGRTSGESNVLNDLNCLNGLNKFFNS